MMTQPGDKDRDDGRVGWRLGGGAKFRNRMPAPITKHLTPNLVALCCDVLISLAPMLLFPQPPIQDRYDRNSP
jgi:hypothetical protein